MRNDAGGHSIPRPRQMSLQTGRYSRVHLRWMGAEVEQAFLFVNFARGYSKAVTPCCVWGRDFV